jgi:hypothetical protein
MLCTDFGKISCCFLERPDGPVPMLIAMASCALAPALSPPPRMPIVGALAPARSPPPRMLFDWLRSVGPDYTVEDDLSPRATAVLNSIRQPAGWEVRCEIGSAVAKALGGSGTLATGPETSNAALELRLSFGLDEGYVPPQGPVKLLRASRYFDEVGFWKVDSDTDDGVPQQVQWRLQSPSGLELGGQTLLPPGAVYFNALCTVAEGASGADEDVVVTLERGRITVKEDIGVNTPVFNARGILAEFKIVGTFECVRGREAL